MFAPLVAHTVERQTVPPLTVVHGPSPFAKPHLLSFVSQTALVQVSVPAAGVHVPLSVGFACGGSFGTACPFASVGVQVCIASLHQVPALQSASTLQPPAFTQVPPTLHAPERHTVPPVPIVHGPSPLAYPHLLSLVSQTPLLQTSVPAAAVHVPSSVGFACGGSVGITVPLESCGVHACVLSSHQLPPVQSASTLHPLGGAHVPFMLHVPERHTTPPFVAVHGPSPLA
jgi:hypothetical protein